MAKTKTDAESPESLMSYEGKLGKVYSSNTMDGPFHIIDVVMAEDDEKIQGLCGDDPGFFIDDICDAKLILLNEVLAPVGMACKACVARREEILQSIVSWRKEVATKEAEKEAEAALKKQAEDEKEATNKAKAKATKDETDAKTPSPAEGEKKTAKKGGKKKNGK